MRGVVYGLAAVLPSLLLLAGIVLLATGRRRAGLGLLGAGAGFLATVFVVHVAG